MYSDKSIAIEINHTCSASSHNLHTASSWSREQTKSADSQNSSSSSSSVQPRHQRHQRRYWLSGISKWTLATSAEEALGTKPLALSNSIRRAWAQHFSSAALCCLENWKILVMLLASSCYLPEADAVECESLGTGQDCSSAALCFFLNAAVMLMSLFPGVLMCHPKADGFQLKVLCIQTNTRVMVVLLCWVWARCAPQLEGTDGCCPAGRTWNN